MNRSHTHSLLLAITAALLALPLAPAAAECHFYEGLDAMTAGDFREAAVLFDECIEERPNDVGLLLNYADCVVRGMLHEQYANTAKQRIDRAFGIAGEQTEIRRAHGLLGQILDWEAHRIPSDEEHMLERIAALENCIDHLERGGRSVLADIASEEAMEARKQLEAFKNTRYAEARTVLAASEATMSRYNECLALLSHVDALAGSDSRTRALRSRLVDAKTERRQVLRTRLRAAVDSREWRYASGCIAELLIEPPYDSALLDQRDFVAGRIEEIEELKRAADISSRVRDHGGKLDAYRELRRLDRTALYEAYTETLRVTYRAAIARAEQNESWNERDELVRARSDDDIPSGPGWLGAMILWLRKHRLLAGIGGILLGATIAGVWFAVGARRKDSDSQEKVDRARKAVGSEDPAEQLWLLESAWRNSVSTRGPDAQRLIAEVAGRIELRQMDADDASRALEFFSLVRESSKDSATVVRLLWKEALGILRTQKKDWRSAVAHVATVADGMSFLEGTQWVAPQLLAGMLSVTTPLGWWESCDWSKGQHLPLGEARVNPRESDRPDITRELGQMLVRLVARFPDRHDEVVQLLPAMSQEGAREVRLLVGTVLMKGESYEESSTVLESVLASIDAETMTDEAMADLVVDWASAVSRTGRDIDLDAELGPLTLALTSLVNVRGGRDSQPRQEESRAIAATVLRSIERIEDVASRIDYLEQLPRDVPGVARMLARCYVERGDPSTHEELPLRHLLQEAFDEATFFHLLRVVVIAGGLRAVREAVESMGDRVHDLGRLESCVRTVIDDALKGAA